MRPGTAGATPSSNARVGTPEPATKRQRSGSGAATPGAATPVATATSSAGLAQQVRRGLVSGCRLQALLLRTSVRHLQDPLCQVQGQVQAAGAGDPPGQAGSVAAVLIKSEQSIPGSGGRHYIAEHWQALVHSGQGLGALASAGDCAVPVALGAEAFGLEVLSGAGWSDAMTRVMEHALPVVTAALGQGALQALLGPELPRKGSGKGSRSGGAASGGAAKKQSPSSDVTGAAAALLTAWQGCLDSVESLRWSAGSCVQGCVDALDSALAAAVR